MQGLARANSATSGLGMSVCAGPSGARFRIPDSKTETGIREVQISPDLVTTIAEHLDCLRRTGAPTGPDDYLVPDLHGNRMEYGRVEQIVREAGETRVQEAR
jgi:hypothetical protein